jgi:hypothetical protein
MAAALFFNLSNLEESFLLLGCGFFHVQDRWIRFQARLPGQAFWFGQVGPASWIIIDFRRYGFRHKLTLCLCPDFLMKLSR